MASLEEELCWSENVSSSENEDEERRDASEDERQYQRKTPVPLPPQTSSTSGVASTHGQRMSGKRPVSAPVSSRGAVRDAGELTRKRMTSGIPRSGDSKEDMNTRHSTPRNDPRVGSNLADFYILGEIGRGTYGTVYKVRSKKNGSTYVAKQIGLRAMKPSRKQKALAEAQLLRELDHPHIVKYFSSFIDNDSLYIVMEYAARGDLHRLYRKHKKRQAYFSERLIWKFAVELADALLYLHDHRIIHRDLKCLNVFLTEDKKIKIGDLGVSKIVGEEEFLHTQAGTPAFFAPELVRKKPYDYKVDVWGYGCLLYQLAALRAPFEGTNVFDLASNIVHKQPLSLPNEYSASLKTFIMSMLEKTASKRPDMHGVFRMFPPDILSQFGSTVETSGYASHLLSAGMQATSSTSGQGTSTATSGAAWSSEMMKSTGITEGVSESSILQRDSSLAQKAVQRMISSTADPQDNSSETIVRSRGGDSTAPTKSSSRQVFSGYGTRVLQSRVQSPLSSSSFSSTSCRRPSSALVRSKDTPPRSDVGVEGARIERKSSNQTCTQVITESQSTSRHDLTISVDLQSKGSIPAHLHALELSDRGSRSNSHFSQRIPASDVRLRAFGTRQVDEKSSLAVVGNALPNSSSKMMFDRHIEVHENELDSDEVLSSNFIPAPPPPKVSSPQSFEQIHASPHSPKFVQGGVASGYVNAKPRSRTNSRPSSALGVSEDRERAALAAAERHLQLEDSIALSFHGPDCSVSREQIPSNERVAVRSVRTGPPPLQRTDSLSFIPLDDDDEVECDLDRDYQFHRCTSPSSPSVNRILEAHAHDDTKRPASKLGCRASTPTFSLDNAAKRVVSHSGDRTTPSSFTLQDSRAPNTVHQSNSTIVLHPPGSLPMPVMDTLSLSSNLPSSRHDTLFDTFSSIGSVSVSARSCNRPSTESSPRPPDFTSGVAAAARRGASGITTSLPSSQRPSVTRLTSRISSASSVRSVQGPETSRNFAENSLGLSTRGSESSNFSYYAGVTSFGMTNTSGTGDDAHESMDTQQQTSVPSRVVESSHRPSSSSSRRRPTISDFQHRRSSSVVLSR